MKILRQEPSNTSTRFTRFFIYGTLKTNGPNHHVIHRKVHLIQKAYAYGLLKMIPEGYPALLVPEEYALASGSIDLYHDLNTEHDFMWISTNLTAIATTQWKRVEGELMTFNHPIATMAALDRYEDYHPFDESLYLRKLIVCIGEDHIQYPAWTYTITPDRIGISQPLDSFPI